MNSSKSSKELYAEVLKYLKGECGVVTDADKKTVFEKCKKAADDGYLPAKNLLGIFYFIGYGTKINKPLAVDCFFGCMYQNDSRDSWDLAIYNLVVARIEENGIEGSLQSALYLERWVDNLQNDKLAKLMFMIRNHLVGELFATGSNIGDLMWLVSMKSSHCFLDVDGTIKWINSKGCLSESANKGFNRLL